eukprot:m.715565 g.715565  ORF g.715565 m.715565 type:complete len:280 (-) comp58788_c0_seq26:37-876(-)
MALQMWAYINQIKQTPNKEIAVLQLRAATEDEEASYISLFTYFHSRNRCGVLRALPAHIKDLYVVPVGQVESVAAFRSLELFEPGEGIPETRGDMLVAIVVSRTSSAKAAPPPPQPPTSHHSSAHRSDRSKRPSKSSSTGSTRHQPHSASGTPTEDPDASMGSYSPPQYLLAMRSMESEQTSQHQTRGSPSRLPSADASPAYLQPTGHAVPLSLPTAHTLPPQHYELPPASLLPVPVRPPPPPPRAFVGSALQNQPLLPFPPPVVYPPSNTWTHPSHPW